MTLFGLPNSSPEKLINFLKQASASVRSKLPTYLQQKGLLPKSNDPKTQLEIDYYCDPVALLANLSQPRYKNNFADLLWIRATARAEDMAGYPIEVSSVL